MSRRMWIINISWFLVLIASTWGAYENTKKSYRQVGYNSGRIDAKWQVIEDLKKYKKIPSCHDLATDDSVPFMDVKATSLNIVRDKSDGFSFCILE